MSAYEQWSLSLPDAIANEFQRGGPALTQEARAGATRFKEGAGRGGDFATI